jgi:hypothetical protein
LAGEGRAVAGQGPFDPLEVAGCQRSIQMADAGVDAAARVPGSLGCELAPFLLADLSWVDCADERCRPEVLPTAGEGVVEAFLAAWRDHHTGDALSAAGGLPGAAQVSEFQKILDIRSDGVGPFDLNGKASLSPGGCETKVGRTQGKALVLVSGHRTLLILGD